MTVFGRDTIITCLQTLVFGPELARTALGVLADLQAKEDDPTIDAEPGKIVHEVRHGKAARTLVRAVLRLCRRDAAVPRPALGGVAVDGRRCARTRSQSPAMLALEWIDKYGDRDGDGFVEYERRTERGLENQSWKDSWDSQRFHDGTLAKAPIAPCEVQGYVYDAKRRIAELAREVWRERELATRLEREAEELRQRFDDAFWVEERGGYYALALDGEKRKVDSLCSNIGHLLWSGIVPAHRVDAVVDQLMGDELWSGWGVRTMSTGDAGLQPALVPQRHGLAPRQFPDRLRASRATRAGRRLSASRSACSTASQLLQLPAPEVFAGMRRVRDAVPDRVPDRRASAGLGGRDAGAAASAAARPRSRTGDRHAPRNGRALDLPSWAGTIRLYGRPRLRQVVGCPSRRRPRAREEASAR